MKKESTRKGKAAPPAAKDRLFDVYRALHEQSLVPIFVQNEHDSKMMVEACVAAGCKGIEYTQRRPDIGTILPWIRKRFPDLYVLVGSTIDDDALVARARRRHPQLRTIAEYADLGAHGFVSMTAWNPENIRKFSRTHLVIPAAMTIGEAHGQLSAGAHFIKVLGTNPEKAETGTVSLFRAAPLFGICPVMYAGWVRAHEVGELVAAGSLAFATGMELMLEGEGQPVAPKRAVEMVRRFLDAAREARVKHWPTTIGGDRKAWLDSLPHHHPF